MMQVSPVHVPVPAPVQQENGTPALVQAAFPLVPGSFRLIVMLGVNSNSPVMTSATEMVNVRPLQALHVPAPAAVQHANGVFMPVHCALLPPLPVADAEKTPGSIFAPTHTDEDESPHEGVCLMLLSVTSPTSCGELEVFWIDRLTPTLVCPTCTI